MHHKFNLHQGETTFMAKNLLNLLFILFILSYTSFVNAGEILPDQIIVKINNININNIERLKILQYIKGNEHASIITGKDEDNNVIIENSKVLNEILRLYDTCIKEHKDSKNYNNKNAICERSLTSENLGIGIRLSVNTDKKLIVNIMIYRQ